MAVVKEDFRCDKEISGNSLRISVGKHAEDKFHPSSGRRLAESVIHLRVMHYEQASGADIADDARVIGTLMQAADLKEIIITPEDVPSHNGATDKTYTVQISWGNAANAFASLLPSGTAIEIDSDDADRTAINPTPTKTAFERGDQFKIALDAIGANNSQGQGVSIDLVFFEHPDE